MPSLVKRYSDLLPTLDDPALNRLVTDLDRAYGAANPAVTMPPELRENIAATLARRAERPPAPVGRLHLPRSRSRRAGLAAILLAALLGGGVVGLALHDPGQSYYPPLNEAPYGYAPQLAGTMAHYGRQIDASLLMCGYTVTVRRAYADANRITLAVSIGSPIRTILDLTGTGAPSLTDAHGAKLRWLGGSLGATTAGVSTMSASFDAHAVSHDASPLHLRFTLPSFDLVEHYNHWSSQIFGCERDKGSVPVGSGNASLLDRLHAFGARLAPTLFQTQPAQAVHIDQAHSLPFTVPFTVPIDRVGAEIQPNEAVTAGGVTLILDRVIATRSEVRVYLRRSTAGSILLDAYPSLFGGGACRGAMPLFGDYWTHQAPASRRYDFSIPCASYHPHAAYTLWVQPNPYATYPAQPWLALRGGPWSFHFRLP